MDTMDSAFWDLFENQRVKGLLGAMRSTLAKIKKSGHIDSRWFNAMGEMSVLEKNFTAALSFFRKAIELNPKPDYELNLGNALFSYKDFLGAKRVLSAYLQKHPDDIHVLVNLANCHLELGEFSQVDQLCSLALQGKVAKAPLLNCLGQVEFLRKNFSKAWELFDQAYADAPEYIDALFNRGNTAYQLGNLTEALEDFKQCLRKDENYSAALLNLALIYLESGEWQSGKESIQKVLKLNSEIVEAYYLLGQLHTGSKNFRAARDVFQTGLKLDPNCIVILLGLAKLHIQEAEKDEAASILKQVLSFKNLKSEERVNALTLLMTLEQYSQCLLYIMYLPQSDIVPVLKKIQIFCLWKSGKIKVAIEHLDLVLESEGESADILTLLGRMLTQSGAEELGEARYRRAFDLEPGLQSAGCELARLYLQRNEIQKAVVILDEVLQKHPNDPDCLYNLACCYAKNENLKDSLYNLKQAIENGFNDLEKINADEDLMFIRQSDEYNRLASLLA